MQLEIEHVGTKIRELRHKKCLTQQALADKCGVHVNWVGMVERGRTSPSVDSLLAFAKGLEVSPKDLLPW